MRLHSPAQSRVSSYAPDTLVRPHSWGEEAACLTADPDLFFADGDDAKSRADQKLAREICGRCPSRPQCLSDALERDEPGGMWGGLTYDERRGLLPYRPAARKQPARQETGSGSPPGEHAATA